MTPYEFKKTHDELQALAERQPATYLTLAAVRLFDEMYTTPEERNQVIAAVWELAAGLKRTGTLMAFEIVCAIGARREWAQ